MEIAKPYIRIRAFSFFPMLFSFVGFSAFRGMALVETSVKVTMLATIVTIFLEPIFIFVCKIGVRGAAMASLVGELISATLYLFLLKEKQLISLAKIFRIPPIESLAPLVKGGISLQIRSVCLNLTFLMGARKIQALDTTGVAASAHALAAQTFQLGGIFLGALGMASQTMVPQAMVNKNSSSIANAKPLMNRLLQWGSILGVLIGLVQLALLPAILKSSPLPAVRQAARVPALIAIAFQGVNGVVSVGEGSMMGTGHFSWLSLNVVLAALGYLAALRVFPEQFGLAGVWMSLSCFTLIRLVGVLFHLCRRLPSLEKEQQLRQTL
jgi:Na+-driven multidrug efflux pump